MTPDPNDIVERYCRNWDGLTPYARATVVHTNGATAAKAGAKAIVTFDGELIGWIGGGCLRGAVLRAARQAMDTAEPRLIRVRPKEQITAPKDPDGVELHANGCPGKGKADVFIEPVMPKPPLVVIGTTHIARALSDLASSLSVELIAIGGDSEEAQLSALARAAGARPWLHHRGDARHAATMPRSKSRWRPMRPISLSSPAGPRPKPCATGSRRTACPRPCSPVCARLPG